MSDKDVQNPCSELLEKFTGTHRYLRDFQQNHWRYVKLLAGEPATLYKLEGEQNKNLIKPITTGTLSRVCRRLRQQAIQDDIAAEPITPYDKDDYRYTVAKYIIDNIILTDSTASKAAFTKKLGISFENALAFGYSPVFVSYEKNASGEPTVKMKLLNYADIFPEIDKDTSDDINWCFVRLWYSKQDLENMKGVWDDEAIEKTLEAGVERKMGATNKRDSDDLRTSYQNQEGYPILVYMNRDRKSDIVYLSPRAEVELYRHKKYEGGNGLRASLLVNGADSQGALGHSLFENLERIQEALDEQLQGGHFQMMQELLPPLWLSGIHDVEISMKPFAVNYGKQGSTLAPIRSTNTVPQNMMAIQKMLTGVVTNATGVDDTSIPSADNSGGLSKTDTGIKQQQAMMDIVTNYHDINLKAFLSEYISTAYKVFVSYSKATGVKKLTINDYEVLASIPSGMLDEDNSFLVDWDDLTLNGISISIGPGEYGTTSSKMEALRQLMNAVNSAQGQNPVLLAVVKETASLLNLDGSEELNERINEWYQIAKEKEKLNQKQQELQLKQMEQQLNQGQQSAPIQQQQMEQQAQEQTQLQPLKTQADRLQLEAQIKQLTMQLQQMDQQAQNPQAQQSQQEQPPMMQ